MVRGICSSFLTMWLAFLHQIHTMPADGQVFNPSDNNANQEISYYPSAEAFSYPLESTPPESDISLWKASEEIFEKHSADVSPSDELTSVIFGVRRPRNQFESDLKINWPFSYRLGFNAHNPRFKTVRTERMTSDGVIEGELVFISPHGRERGVRYTAQPGIEPLLLYRSLLHFLKLTT